MQNANFASPVTDTGDKCDLRPVHRRRSPRAEYALGGSEQAEGKFHSHTPNHPLQHPRAHRTGVHDGRQKTNTRGVVALIVWMKFCSVGFLDPRLQGCDRRHDSEECSEKKGTIHSLFSKNRVTTLVNEV